MFIRSGSFAIELAASLIGNNPLYPAARRQNTVASGDSVSLLATLSYPKTLPQVTSHISE
jgi:hypothetical protein